MVFEKKWEFIIIANSEVFLSTPTSEEWQAILPRSWNLVEDLSVRDRFLLKSVNSHHSGGDRVSHQLLKKLL